MADAGQNDPAAQQLSDDDFANLLMQGKVEEIETAAQGQLQDEDFDAILGDMSKTGTSNEEIDALKFAHLTKKYGKARIARMVSFKTGKQTGFQVLNDNGLPVATYGGTDGYAVQVRRQAQSEMLKDADTTSGANVTTRLLANLKMTPQGKYNYLETEYGKGNVTPIFSEDGEMENFLLRREGEEKQVLFDPPAGVLSDLPGDVADITGDVIEGIPGAIGSVIGGTSGAIAGGTAGTAVEPGGGTVAGAAGGGVAGALIGGAAGDVIGGVGRQIVAGLVPGEEDLTLGERAAAVGTGVATGVVGEGVGRGLGALAKKLSPRSRLAKLLGREVAEGGADVGRPALDVAQEALKEEEAAGITFSLEQLTGGRTAGDLAKTIRQMPGGAGTMFKADVERAAGAARFVEKTIEATAGPAVGSSAAGRRVAGAVDNHLKMLAKNRSTEAKALFGAADAEAGGARVMELTNTLAAMDELIESGSAPLLAGSDRAISEAMKAKKAELTKRPAAAASALFGPDGSPIKGTTTTAAALSIGEFSNAMASFGKAASGVGYIIKDLDTAADRRVAAKISAALRKDLDQAIEGGGVAGGAATKLADARKAYAVASQQIDDAKIEPFKKILKMEFEGAPDKVAGEFLKTTFSPDQVRTAMLMLDKIDPAAAKQMRGAVLMELVEKAAPGTESLVGKAGVSISPAKMATLGDKHAKRIEALMAGDPGGLADWKTAVRVMKRLGSAGERQGSDTATKLWWGKAMSAIASPRVAVGSGQGMLTQLATLTSAKRLAHIFNDREARKIFLKLVEPPPRMSPTIIRQNMARLIGIVERNEAMFNKGAGSEKGDVLQ